MLTDEKQMGYYTCGGRVVTNVFNSPSPYLARLALPPSKQTGTFLTGRKRYDDQGRD